jgi:short-subunit dehydrogenase
MDALQRSHANTGNDTNLAFIIMDVTDPSSIATAVTKTQEQLKKWNITHLFGLVNNAGIAHTREMKYVKALVELPDSEMLGMFGVNIFGVIRCTNAFYPLMKQHFNERNIKDDDASIIVNIASMAGLIAGPYFSYYTATKFAVVGYSDSLRRELRHAGIRVTCIEPGFTATAIVEVPSEYDPTPFAEDIKSTWEFYQSRAIEPMMKPSQISEGTISAIFASQETTPAHIRIDQWRKFVSHWLMMYLPSKYSDKLFAAISAK